MTATRKPVEEHSPHLVSRQKMKVLMHLTTEAADIVSVTPEEDGLVDSVLSVKVGFPPVARADARVLILGSLPGDASLASAQYYAHPRNQFWRLLSVVIGQNLSALDYKEQLAALQSAGIALWDVVGEANRAGSLDHHIRNEQLNDIRKFIDGLPQLSVIAFNGKKAAVLAGNAFNGVGLDVIYLPSSSPAYTLSAEAKAAKWVEMASHLNIKKKTVR